MVSSSPVETSVDCVNSAVVGSAVECSLVVELISVVGLSSVEPPTSVGSTGFGV